MRELLACAIEVLACCVDFLEVYESCLCDLDMAALSTTEVAMSSCASVEASRRIVQEQEFIARFWPSRSMRELLVCSGCGSIHERGDFVTPLNCTCSYV